MFHPVRSTRKKGHWTTTTIERVQLLKTGSRGQHTQQTLVTVFLLFCLLAIRAQLAFQINLGLKSAHKRARKAKRIRSFFGRYICLHSQSRTLGLLLPRHSLSLHDTHTTGFALVFTERNTHTHTHTQADEFQTLQQGREISRLALFTNERVLESEYDRRTGSGLS